MYRITRPDRYKSGCPGHTNPGARQGFYSDKATPQQARFEIAERLEKEDPVLPGEKLDIQDWNGGKIHGCFVDSAGESISSAQFG